jgi:hypothetical protein
VISHGKLSFHVCFNSVGRVRTSQSFGRYAVYFSPSVPTCPHAPPPGRFSVGSRVSLLFEANEAPMPRFEKFRHKTTILTLVMRLNPTIAWRASPTRTPPPICTSAPFLKPRWSQEPWAPRTFLEIHHALIPATEMIRCGCRENRLRGRQIRQPISCIAARF